jgi:hypothetical protein
MVSTPMRLGKRKWPSGGMKLYTSFGPTRGEKGAAGWGRATESEALDEKCGSDCFS